MNVIKDVNITFIKPNNGLICFASLVLNNQIYLSSIGVHEKLGGGYRLTYPTKQIGGNNLNIFHPINKETSLAIEKAVISKLKDVMNKYDRHDSFDA